MVIVFMRAAIGTTFLTSALFKVVAPRAFADSLPALGVPRRFARAFAVAVILMEATVAVCMLLGGPVLPVGIGLAAVLLLLFSAVLARALARGVGASCHCFGSGSTPVSRTDLVRNGGLFLVLIGGCVTWAIFGSSTLLSIGTTSYQAPVESIVTAAAGLGVAMAWSQLPEIVTLIAEPRRRDIPRRS